MKQFLDENLAAGKNVSMDEWKNELDKSKVKSNNEKDLFLFSECQWGTIPAEGRLGTLQGE